MKTKIHLVQSRTDPNTVHKVEVNGDDICCSCVGFSCRRTCAHAEYIKDKHYKTAERAKR